MDPGPAELSGGTRVYIFLLSGVFALEIPVTAGQYWLYRSFGSACDAEGCLFC